MSWTLDTSAIICWLTGEPGVQRAEAIIAGPDPVEVHAINLVEVEYLLLRRGQAVYEAAMLQMRAAGIIVARDVDDEFLARAAELKAFQAPIALADTFAVALAMKRGNILLTTDRRELTKIADAGLCAIEFLR